MVHANKKTKHALDYSYSREFGSSFDPALEEDIEEWESSVKGWSIFYLLSHPRPHCLLETPNSKSQYLTGARSLDEEAEQIDFTPADLFDEEVEAYAADWDCQAALADFEDLPEEALFGPWSDQEDEPGVDAVASQSGMEMEI